MAQNPFSRVPYFFFRIWYIPFLFRLNVKNGCGIGGGRPLIRFLFSMSSFPVFHILIPEMNDRRKKNPSAARIMVSTAGVAGGIQKRMGIRMKLPRRR